MVKVAGNPGTAPIATRAGRMLQRFGISLLTPSEEMIDWYEVAGTAMDVAGEDYGETQVDATAAHEFDDYIRKVSPQVAEFTGLELKQPLPSPVVFNKSEWIVTTVTTLKPLLEMVLKGVYKPIALDENDSYLPNRVLKAATAAEIGLILGYLSGRVLGQYDVPLMGDGKIPAAFYFIYPNILEAESKLGLESRHFRLWLVLHEVTHGYQFEANPWLKDYLKKLIEESTAYVEARLARLASGPPGAESGFMDWPAKLLFTKSMRELISPEENPVLAKAQALMSILEGYSEYVMETAGADIIEGGRGIADLLDEARRTRSWAHKLIERLIGLELKVQQYRSGYLFIKQTVDVGGMRLANLVWQGPQSMPTLTELRSPELWIKRMLKTQG